jgi:hypothetical protein
MNGWTRFARLAAAALVATAGLSASSGLVLADEGMWTYDHPPLKQLEERYGFKPTQEWLNHLRLSSVDMYASGSFVSPDGLMLTNHHVALFSLQRLSTPEHNYVRDGFYAKTQAEEAPIPGMTVRVLVSTVDVTARVMGAVKAGASPAEAKAQQDAETAAIEAECLKKTGMSGAVVPLFGGAKRVLYRYKEYSDVRLVFAPELQAAFFGGDYDNFTYPRYDFDVAFMRAYENGKPAHVDNYLKVNPRGCADGDLVFVSGHPGKTDRLQPFSSLVYYRDVTYPHMIEHLHHLSDILTAYSAKGPEEARRARTSLYFVANSLKAREGEYRGLKDPELMAKKVAAEHALRKAVLKDEKLNALYGSAWDDMEAAYAWAKDHENERLYRTGMPGGRGLGMALTLVRYPVEVAKPDAARLNGFHEADLDDTLRYVKAPSPFYPDLEELLLADDLEAIAKAFGPGDPYVKALLGGKTPAEAAKVALAGTRLGDAAFRRELLANRGKAVAKCADPLLDLARRADPFIRETQKMFRDKLSAVEDEGLRRIAEAQFAVYGEDAYPDATGTLRLSYGKVAGYPFATTLVPPFTTFYGLYDRAYSFGNKGDFELAPKEAEGRDRLDLATPFNFVCTADITGGNSGSPVVDREGRLVGLVFDGNMESHPNTFLYDEKEARCVAVDIRGILEGLTKLYGAAPLVQEMLDGAK